LNLTYYQGSIRLGIAGTEQYCGGASQEGIPDK